MGEYNATGQLIQEIVWLDDLPIAVLKPNAAQSMVVDSFYIHSDHLATPRKITRPSDNKAVWSWESEAFGNTLPNQNPSNLGSFVFNLRFPGHYYDQETGLHYNVFRDYDPGNGRYIESDPIGLTGGINTYTYVGNNPLNLIDPNGLAGIYVNYPNYPITVPGTEAQLPLGHAAVIAVDDNTGTTKYFEYGRYDSDFGQVKQRTVPDLVLDENGNPTPASLSNLYNYIGARYGDQTSVDATYYPDANYQKIIDFALQRKNDPNRAPYSWNPFSSNTCKTFAKDAISAGQQK